MKALGFVIRWIWHNRATPSTWREFDTGLLALAAERGDLAWPAKTRRWTRGRHVLDVGCGRNLQGLGFLAYGAKRYTGLDPTIDLDSTILKDSRSVWSKRVESGISARALMSMQPRLRFEKATVEEFANAAPGCFEVIVMHNVTEHLMEIEKEFERLAKLLKPGGRIVFRHPNYYCWHGHHCRPRTIAEIDLECPKQAKVMDWAHVHYDPIEHEWIGRTQNRIRLDELRALVERHFDIELWRDSHSTREQGIERLTPEIRARCAGFSERDLTVRAALIVGRIRIRPPELP